MNFTICPSSFHHLSVTVLTNTLPLHRNQIRRLCDLCREARRAKACVSRQIDLKKTQRALRLCVIVTTLLFF